MMKNNILDNSELQLVMDRLESIEDEVLGVELLKEFNDASAKLGKLLLNKDENLDHQEWKKDCDQAKVDLDQILKKIERASQN